jgi:hypothetical protein
VEITVKGQEGQSVPQAYLGEQHIDGACPHPFLAQLYFQGGCFHVILFFRDDERQGGESFEDFIPGFWSAESLCPLFSNQFFHGEHVAMMPESELPLKQRMVAKKQKAPGVIPGAFKM